MNYNKYNNLLTPTDLENFKSSLDKPNGFTFNSLINIFEEEGINYNVKTGFNKDSKDKDINSFNKIEIVIKNEKKLEKICGEYELEEIFQITKNKGNLYTFLYI